MIESQSGGAPSGTRICIFAKPPEPGHVNTRLVPALGEAGAARLAHAFLQDTLALARSCGWAEVILATTGPMSPFLVLPDDVEEWPQGEGDLGERVERVMRRALAGAPAAVALGVDSPGLPRPWLDRIGEALLEADSVIGPTADGGFYALGLTRITDGLLRDLTWGAPTTYHDTLGRLRAFGYAPVCVPEWYDVDVPDDLARLEREIESGTITAPHTARALRAITGR